MSFFPGNDPHAGDAFACDAIENLIIPRTSDLGGFSVRRALPSSRRRLVGPFIFFDRMGPAIFRPGQAVDVRPHPHIGLSTVTYLFDGEIRHLDSLGTAKVIRPGDVNLMTAGRGIVHSNAPPKICATIPLRCLAYRHGWHFPTTGRDRPLLCPYGERRATCHFRWRRDWARGDRRFRRPEISGEILHRHALRRSAASAERDVSFGAAHEERAVYILSGSLIVAGDHFAQDQLLVFRPGDAITLEAAEKGCHLMLFGGAALNSKRYIWWNFVSSSKERIEKAKEEWRTGRFDIVPGDEEEFIPLPEG